jgi:hypothetical protein
MNTPDLTISFFDILELFGEHEELMPVIQKIASAHKLLIVTDTSDKEHLLSKWEDSVLAVRKEFPKYDDLIYSYGLHYVTFMLMQFREQLEVDDVKQGTIQFENLTS